MKRVLGFGWGLVAALHLWGDRGTTSPGTASLPSLEGLEEMAFWDSPGSED